MKKILHTFLAICFSILAFSQPSEDYNAWQTYFQNGTNYYNYQELDKAANAFNNAFNIAEEIFEVASNEFMSTAYSYAVILVQLEQNDLAQEPMEKAIIGLKALYGETNEQYAGALTILANIYIAKKDYKLAEAKYIESNDLLKIVYGEDHMMYGIGLTNLAGLYRETGNFKKALNTLNEGLDILKNDPYFDKGSYNKLRYNNLPSIYQGLGRLEDALEIEKESLDYIKRNYGVFNSNYANILTSIGGIYVNLGYFNKAEKVLLEAADIFEELNDSTNDKALGNTYMFLVACYTETSDYKKAFYYASKGIELTELNETNLKVSSIQYYEILSNLSWKLQNYEQVEEYLKIAIQLTKSSAGDNAPTLPVLISRLSMCYLNMDKIEEAEKFAKLAFNKSKALNLTIKDNSYRECLDNLSAILVEQKKYKQAIKNIESTLREEDKNYPNYWHKQIDLANVYLMDHQCKKASTLLDAAIKRIKTLYGKENPDYIDALNSLIIAQKCEKQYGEVIKNVKQANELTKQQLVKQFSFSTNDLKRIFLAEIEASFNIYESINFDNPQEELTTINLENKYILKGLLLNQAKNVTQKLKALNEPDINKLINDYIDNKQFLQSVEDKNNEKFDTLKEELKKTVDHLEIQLVQLYNDRFKEPINFKKKWTKVRDQLKADEVAIEFSRFNYITHEVTDSTYYVAYIIKKDSKQPKVISLFEESTLQKLFSNSSNPKKLYNTRGSKARSTNQTSNTSELYQLIWKPLEPELNHITNVYFAPTGLLHNVSFSSLRNNNNWLVNKYNLIQLSSTYDITSNLNTLKPDNVLLVGGITYDYEIKEEVISEKAREPQPLDLIELNRSKKNNTWNYLPGTLSEVESIDTLLLNKNVDKNMLTGTNANETYFKRLSGKSPKVLHIATHGFFFENNDKKASPLKSKTSIKYKTDYNPLNRTGLLFSGANYAWINGSNPPNEKENGIITAEEISTLDFSKTDIVVLSACETGLGDIEGSEGVYGLQRAFKMAGVDMLMMSLWEVPDKETAEFMTSFYGNWLGGQNIREAFRNTQLKMSDKYKDNPEKWAAFVLF